jgi:hypothetical protein
MRYRLWDIDLIIRKTLIYTVVTGLLALVYFGIVLLLQAMFSALGFDKSPAALVISTLASATLFNPLRRRVQEAIDHRFYRRKYDAQKAVAAFAEKSRDEVDIDRLNLHLLAVIRETVQPRDVSIWVREINSATRQGGKA